MDDEDFDAESAQKQKENYRTAMSAVLQQCDTALSFAWQKAGLQQEPQWIVHKECPFRMLALVGNPIIGECPCEEGGARCGKALRLRGTTHWCLIWELQGPALE